MTNASDLVIRVDMSDVPEDQLDAEGKFDTKKLLRALGISLLGVGDAQEQSLGLGGNEGSIVDVYTPMPTASAKSAEQSALSKLGRSKFVISLHAAPA